MPGTGAAFAKAIANLRDRRLPVLVSSGGGSLADAAAMGRLIRQKRLAVAVARALIEKCPARARACPQPKGQAITGGAKCASACPFILAGVERFVGPAAMVGPSDHRGDERARGRRDSSYEGQEGLSAGPC
jgi:hypothetical protein